VAAASPGGEIGADTPFNLPDFLYHVGPLAGQIPTNVQIKQVIDQWTQNTRIVETVEAMLASAGYVNQGSREFPDWVQVSTSGGSTVWLTSLPQIPMGDGDIIGDFEQSTVQGLPTLLPGVTPRSEEGVFLSEDWWENQLPTQQQNGGATVFSEEIFVDPPPVIPSPPADTISKVTIGGLGETIIQNVGDYIVAHIFGDPELGHGGGWIDAAVNLGAGWLGWDGGNDPTTQWTGQTGNGNGGTDVAVTQQPGCKPVTKICARLVNGQWVRYYPRHRRRKRLATASEIADLSSLKAVLTGKQLEVWIARRST